MTLTLTPTIALTWQDEVEHVERLEQQQPAEAQREGEGDAFYSLEQLPYEDLATWRARLQVPRTHAPTHSLTRVLTH